jgi:Ca-activated chloride channel family protein
LPFTWRSSSGSTSAAFITVPFSKDLVMGRVTNVVLSAVVVSGAAAAVPTMFAAEQATFRTGTELVAMTVTVTDRAGQQVSGLTESDFVVTEDGVPQPVSFFVSGHVPLDLAIVLDTSGSMGGELRVVQDAACGLARTLRPGDRAAVVDVKSGVRLPQPFTDDISSVEAAIHRTTPGGNTGLHDGLYVVLKEFERERRANPAMRRQALVVLSDGRDNSSHVTFDHALDLARRVGVGVYVVSPKSPASGPADPEDFEYATKVQYSMNTLVREAGGRIFFPTSSRDLRRVYGTIASELANQYELGYVPIRSERDGRFRRISVRLVNRTDAEARTRTGYFADGLAFVRMHSSY